MTTDNFCFYLQNKRIQTSQTGGQWDSDTSPFSIPAPSKVILSGRHFLMKLCAFIVRNSNHRKPFELVGGI